MGFKQAEYNQNGNLVGGYAKMWSIKFNQKYADVRISISRKNKQTNEYETEFARYVRFIGHAFQRLCNIYPTLNFVQTTNQNGDVICEAPKNNEGKSNPPTIRLRNVDVTNKYDKEKKTEYVNCLVYEFDLVEEQQQNSIPNGIPFNNVPQNNIPMQNNGIPFSNTQQNVPASQNNGMPFNNVPQGNGVPFNGAINEGDNDIISDDGVPF